MGCNVILGPKRQSLPSPRTILASLCPDYLSHDLHHCLKTKIHFHDGGYVSINLLDISLGQGNIFSKAKIIGDFSKDKGLVKLVIGAKDSFMQKRQEHLQQSD
jgi:hypothetical protein